MRRGLILFLAGWMFGALFGGFWGPAALALFLVTTALMLSRTRRKTQRERDHRGRFKRSRVAEEVEAMLEVEEFLEREMMEEDPALRNRRHQCRP